MVVVSCVAVVSNCAMESTCDHTLIPKRSSSHSSDERLTREACDRLSFRQLGCVRVHRGWLV